MLLSAGSSRAQNSPLGEQVRLTFFLPNGFAIKAVGTVRWRSENRGSKPQLGLMIDLGATARAQIESLAEAA